MTALYSAKAATSTWRCHCGYLYPQVSVVGESREALDALAFVMIRCQRCPGVRLVALEPAELLAPGLPTGVEPCEPED